MSEIKAASDPVAEFVDNHQEWLEEEANSEMPDAWVCAALLDVYNQGGES